METFHILAKYQQEQIEALTASLKKLKTDVDDQFKCVFNTMDDLRQEKQQLDAVLNLKRQINEKNIELHLLKKRNEQQAEISYQNQGAELFSEEYLEKNKTNLPRFLKIYNHPVVSYIEVVSHYPMKHNGHYMMTIFNITIRCHSKISSLNIPLDEIPAYPTEFCSMSGPNSCSDFVFGELGRDVIMGSVKRDLVGLTTYRLLPFRFIINNPIKR